MPLPPDLPGLLLVTTDPDLEREVTRVAAATGLEPVVRPPGRSADLWPGAPLVLVGDDAATALARHAQRRPDVWLVGTGPPDAHACRAALSLGVHDLVELPVEGHRLGTLLDDLADRLDRDTGAPGEPGGRGGVLGVVGASGGVGASVLALALAQTAAHEGPAALLDLGGGIPLTLLAGVEDEPGVGWEDLAGLDGSLGARELREALPRRAGLGVLSGDLRPDRALGDPRSEPVLREVVAAAARGHRWVVLDLGRGAAPVLDLCDALALVAAPTLTGLPGALHAAGRVPPRVRAGLVVRTGAGWPDDVAGPTGLPVWARLGRQRRLEEHLAAGLGPVRSRRSPYSRAAAAVLTHAAGTPRDRP